jgi:hypothetical protein
MAKVSPNTTLDNLRAAGFKDTQLAVFLAIAFAETGFDAAAVRHEPNGSTSYGEWQINSSHGYPELSNGQWSDPKVNAQLAKRVYDSQGANAWSTHKPSDPIGFARYTGYLPVAVASVTAHFGPVAGAAAAAGAGVSTGAGAAGGAEDVASGALAGVEALLKDPLTVVHWLTEASTWERIGKWGLGGALIFGGILLLARGPIGQAAKTAATEAPKAATLAAA